MSIAEPQKIDIVATKRGSNIVKLVITDHLSWDDVEQHCLMLQDKINTYLAFVESGQLARLKEPEIPPDPAIIVSIAAQFEPPELAIDFLARAREFLGRVGIELEVQRRADSLSQ